MAGPEKKTDLGDFVNREKRDLNYFMWGILGLVILGGVAELGGFINVVPGIGIEPNSNDNGSSPEVPEGTFEP